MNISIINGPNLNMVGQREPDLYGTTSLDTYLRQLTARYPKVEFSVFQSNHEGALIDELHRVGFSATGIVLNAGAYTHTSLALADAVRAIAAPVVEVHLTNVQAREPIRRQSLIAPACLGVIAGLGLDSYRLAIEAFIQRNQP